MNSALLAGRNVKVCANDFIQKDLAALIANVGEHARKLLLELSASTVINGEIYTHAIASPRLARDDLNVLLSTGVLGCAITLVPKDLFDPSNPFDLSWWRGGAAVVTDVMLE